MRRGLAWLVAAGLGMVLGACTCEPTKYAQQTYACHTTDDCAAGFSCVSGVCSQESAAGGGGGSSSGGGSGGGAAAGGGAPAGGGAAGGGAAEGDGGIACADRPEVCGDQVDDNCNGILDDGCDCDAGQPCYPNADGIFTSELSAPQLAYPWDGGAGCSPGFQACLGGHLQQTCIGAHVPVAETCDGRDNDCDGVIDSLLCPCSSGRECYLGGPYTRNVGVCRSGIWNCTLPVGTQCVGLDVGGVEVCNGLDDDCNGLVDDGVMPTDPCGPGVCDTQFKACADGGEVACNLSTLPGYTANDVCGDGLDNNCNGAVDEGCACAKGSMQVCFPGPASACDGGSCYGVCKKGTQTCLTLSDGGQGYGSCSGYQGPSAELCSDGLDNDCDGLVDCADSDCTGRSCGSNGRVCFGGTCQCVFDGGVSSTEICTDRVDDNCNGLIDCADPGCANKTCGTAGKTCVGTTCTCVVDGGVAQALETNCSDGRDNDCDGLVDCAQSSCNGQPCGPNGRTCQQNVCTCLTDGGTPQTTETLCNDGVDNDCDGLVDCADPNCLLKSCASAAGSVCCTTSAAGCTNLTSDPDNCGQCGAQCTSGVCTPSTIGSHSSGRCDCTTSSDCPRPSPSGSRQTCSSSSLLCSCNDENTYCGDAGRCSNTICYYP